MTTTPRRAAARRMQSRDLVEVMSAVESDFGRLPEGLWDPRHHYLLHALDRGEVDRFVVWGDDRPRAVAHLGPTGTVVVAGGAVAAPDLAVFVERSRWRILIGEEDITAAVLRASQKSLFRRRPGHRIQRFMITDPQSHVDAPPTPGFRRGWRNDLDVLEDFACRLHVEDQMGAPLTGGSRVAVRQRMTDSIDRGTTWVVQRDGQVVGKVDLSLNSSKRGAQISGVYVRSDHRGQGVGTGMIRTLCAQLLDNGMPVVSLHVRDDNAAAIRAYTQAGFIPRGRWVLALR